MKKTGENNEKWRRISEDFMMSRGRKDGINVNSLLEENFNNLQFQNDLSYYITILASDKMNKEKIDARHKILLSSVDAYKNGLEIPKVVTDYMMLCLEDYFYPEGDKSVSLTKAFGLKSISQKAWDDLIIYSATSRFLDAFIKGYECGQLEFKDKTKPKKYNKSDIDKILFPHVSNVIEYDEKLELIDMINDCCEALPINEFGKQAGYVAGYKELPDKFNSERIAEFISKLFHINVKSAQDKVTKYKLTKLFTKFTFNYDKY